MAQVDSAIAMELWQEAYKGNTKTQIPNAHVKIQNSGYICILFIKVKKEDYARKADPVR